MDLYEILEINKKCTKDDIKRAYKTLAKKYHPDKCRDKGANDKFIKIRAAYEILSNESSRFEYDKCNTKERGDFYEKLMIYLQSNFPFAHNYIRSWLSEIYDDGEYKNDINSYRLDKVFGHMIHKLPFLSKDVCNPMGVPEYGKILDVSLDVNLLFNCSLEDRYLNKCLCVKIIRKSLEPIQKLIPLRNDVTTFVGEGEINENTPTRQGNAIVKIKINETKGFKFIDCDMLKKVYVSETFEEFNFSHIDGSKIQITKDMIIDDKYVIIKEMGLPKQDNDDRKFRRGDLVIELIKN
jgi:DnaJ-class molecular chaperone